MRKKINLKRSVLSASIAACLGAGLIGAPMDTEALGFFPSFNTGPNKYLVIWAGDQVLDDGFYGQPDQLVVVDADPSSQNYGHVVNSATMPMVFGQHLLAETENVVDNAVTVVSSGAAVSNIGDFLDGHSAINVANGHALYDASRGPGPSVIGGTPGSLWSSTLNESHHFNVKPRIDAAGHKHLFPGGLISSNLFGCDVTDPLHIKPSAGSTKTQANPYLDDPDGNGNLLDNAPTDNICGLAVGSPELVSTSGTDDVAPLPNGNLIVTQMGLKATIDNGNGWNGPFGTHTLVLGPGVASLANGNNPDLSPAGGSWTFYQASGAFPGDGLADGAAGTGVCNDADGNNICDATATLPPTLQTPGGLLEFDVMGNVVGEYPAGIPKGVTYPAGPLAGKRVAPDRYRARYYLRNLLTSVNAAPFNTPVEGVDANNDKVFDAYTDANGNPVPAGVGTPPDTGPDAHPHGMGYRADLNSLSPYWGVYHNGATDGSQMAASDASAVPNKGIFVESDYADPVSLAVSDAGDDFQDLGTTVRFFHLSNLADGPYAVVQVPEGNRIEEAEFHQGPEGLMAMAVTNRPNHKGMFVASMCGGSLYYIPNITKVGTADANGNPNPAGMPHLVYDTGGCTGASVFFITRNDRYLVLPKAGITPNGTVDGNNSANSPAGVNQTFFNRDYDHEHNREIEVFDISKLVAAGDNVQCGAAPASKWDNTGVPQPGSGRPTSVGPATGTAHSREGIDFTTTDPGNNGRHFWPNNDAGDCPTIASRVNLDSPENFATTGGPHFTVADNLERYVATSQYFVDLRRYPVAANWAVFGTPAFDPFNHTGAHTGAVPPDLFDTNAGNMTQTAGAVDPTKNSLSFAGDFLPGTGSVGDNTVCMMKFNRWTGQLSLDPTFNDFTTTGNVKNGCIDMERTNWPRKGDALRPTVANGSASPHAMTFIDVN